MLIGYHTKSQLQATKNTFKLHQIEEITQKLKMILCLHGGCSEMEVDENGETLDISVLK